MRFAWNHSHDKLQAGALCQRLFYFLVKKFSDVEDADWQESFAQHFWSVQDVLRSQIRLSSPFLRQESVPSLGHTKAFREA